MTKRFDVEVSLALGADLTADPSTWSWTDITDYALTGDGGGVTIFRGRLDEQTQAAPSWCTVQLNNADGRFSRLNPAGAYYGQLAKNTPIRIRACATGGTLTTRFVGYVSEWPPRWTHGQKHQWVSVRADGILRRLGQGRTPVKSAARRFYDDVSPQPVAYWPMDTPANLTAGGAAMVVTATDSGGAVEQDWSTTIVASWLEPGAQLSDLLIITPATALDETALATIDMVAHARPTEASAGSWGLNVADSADITVALIFAAWVNGVPTLSLFGGGGPAIDTASASDAAKAWDNTPHHWRIVLDQNGADIDITVYLDGVSIMSGTDTGATLSTIKPWLFTNSGVSGAAGHVVQWSGTPPSVTDAATAVLGHNGELAGARFERLCTEESIPFDVAGTDSAAYAMGPQTIAPLLDLLRECEAASVGVLTERLTGELGLDLLSSRYNLTAALALDHDNGHIVAPFDPTDDDRLTRNDVTVTLPDGRFARATDEDSIAEVGRYDTAPIINLETVEQAGNHVLWLLHVGTSTNDEYRYPTVELVLHKSSSLLTSWLTCDISSLVTMDNLPTDVMPNQARQIIEGYTERINAVAWGVSLNLSPYSPYDTGTYEDTVANATKRYDTLGSTLTAQVVAGTATSFQVTIAAGYPLWTLNSASWSGLQVEAGGVIWDVVSISGTSSPQTFTVTQAPSNGVEKTVAAGTRIRVAPHLRGHYGL